MQLSVLRWHVVNATSSGNGTTRNGGQLWLVASGFGLLCKNLDLYIQPQLAFWVSSSSIIKKPLVAKFLKQRENQSITSLCSALMNSAMLKMVRLKPGNSLLSWFLWHSFFLRIQLTIAFSLNNMKQQRNSTRVLRKCNKMYQTNVATRNNKKLEKIYLRIPI